MKTFLERQVQTPGGNAENELAFSKLSKRIGDVFIEVCHL